MKKAEKEDLLMMTTIIIIITITGLPSNLRPTTCKCVHLVTRGHFQSCDKDGGHTIQSTVVENPMLHATFMALCFMEPKLLLNKFYIAEIRIFYLCCSCDLDPMTYIYELDPYSIETYWMCKYELPMSSYHLTDTHT